MKILIAGGGKIGLSLVRKLSSEGHDVTLIDEKHGVLEDAVNKYDVMAVQGNCASMDILAQADIENSDLLIATMGQDEVNLLCCMTAHNMNRRLHTIARIRNPEYDEQVYKMRDSFALSMILNPERQFSIEIERLLRYPGFLHRESFAKDRVEIVELPVEKDSVLCNCPIVDLQRISSSKVLVCAVLRDGVALIPDGSFVMEEGDRVFVPFVAMGDNISLIFPGYRTSASYQEGRTLQDYFEIAGGSRMQNYGYKALCIREPGKPPRWITLSEMKLTQVAPNTEVEFSLQEMLVYVGGAVNFIGRYPFNPTWHALDYIAAAGINTLTGSWGQVKVWRGKGPQAVSLSVTEDQILPGDFIEVPKSHYESFKDFTLFLASLLGVVSSTFIIYMSYK